MKIEYFLTALLSFGVLGVIFWYFLSVIGLENAAEISALIVIAAITILLAYEAHGKGLLNPFQTEGGILGSVRERENGKYQRKTFHTTLFEREAILKTDYKRRVFRKNPFKRKKTLPFNYKRKKNAR